ncbi:uncharacterized protein LOC127795312 [Diospyros lotus]|uniref:uncharacterized protein LOC127795312 n=1 Tax=Diospyros lotus TaxID=55363 RepID=UPI00225853EB|nr:uncharacterized protein LOC127795312 [Diospyros lotus]
MHTATIQTEPCLFLQAASPTTVTLLPASLSLSLPPSLPENPPLFIHLHIYTYERYISFLYKTHAGMKISLSKLPVILKPSFRSLFSSLAFLAFLALQTKRHVQKPTTTTTIATTSLPAGSDELRIRPGYASYEAYIQRQLNKTLNPKLRKIWTTRDWGRKVRVFAQFFESLKQRGLLSNGSRTLSIGARVGQEVAALKRVGVPDSVGIDLVPRPPLVIKGDFHSQPFDDDTFDFEFSNVFDHALYPWKFVEEIERTLKPGGICVLHVSLNKRADKYSANDLYSVGPLEKLFKRSEMVEVRTVDGFGLDTEVVFRKRKRNGRL